MHKQSVVFFGSGPVALKSLELLSEYMDIEAIVTKPATETAMHRAFPSTPVFSVSRRAELDELCSTKKFHSRFGILIDFGVIVGQPAIDSFPLGIINSHFSLLPEWRGVDPITFAILSGQKQTGVSLMLVVRAWDEGPLLAQAPYDIQPDATTPSLTKDLILLSNNMLRQVIPQYAAGNLVAAPQMEASILNGMEPTYSRKLTKEDGKIDWHKPAEVLEREIRAYLGWPKSYTTLAGREVVILAAKVNNEAGLPGTVVAEHRQLLVACGSGSLEILQLKPAGKGSMSAAAFLAGYQKYL